MPPLTKVVVGVSWFNALLLVALVPLDVIVARLCGRMPVVLMRLSWLAQTMTSDTAAEGTLFTLYAIPYWATQARAVQSRPRPAFAHAPACPPLASQVLTWLLLPTFQMYNDAGDFTVKERVRTSVRENSLFYACLGGVALLVLAITIAAGHVTLDNLALGGAAFSLCFSVATGVLLMGYGLSEVPRACWQRSRLAYLRQLCEHQVGSLSDRLDGAHTELSKVVWSVDAMSNTMPRHAALRWAMDIIDDAVKHSAVAAVTPDEEARRRREGRR